MKGRRKKNVFHWKNIKLISKTAIIFLIYSYSLADLLSIHVQFTPKHKYKIGMLIVDLKKDKWLMNQTNAIAPHSYNSKKRIKTTTGASSKKQTQKWQVGIKPASTVPKLLLTAGKRTFRKLWLHLPSPFWYHRKGDEDPQIPPITEQSTSCHTTQHLQSWHARCGYIQRANAVMQIAWWPRFSCRSGLWYNLFLCKKVILRLMVNKVLRLVV